MVADFIRGRVLFGRRVVIRTRRPFAMTGAGFALSAAGPGRTNYEWVQCGGTRTAVKLGKVSQILISPGRRAGDRVARSPPKFRWRSCVAILTGNRSGYLIAARASGVSRWMSFTRNGSDQSWNFSPLASISIIALMRRSRVSGFLAVCKRHVIA